jgi:hypothetical protein
MEPVQCRACGRPIEPPRTRVTVTADEGVRLQVYVFHLHCWKQLLKQRW